ncbi:unnamed protein product [Phytophthora fragariaefolia]|uniref:Unnamed protein product n=1 Tax=Phytophthora fragariaefolia TaxID=1490495 RepID=A0A9W6XA95_9STRA|nr:unnamed protein product [Phytophthora fragariaefolia]
MPQARSQGIQVQIHGLDDDVDRYRVFNVATGKVQIVRTVKFIETTVPDQLKNRLEDEEACDSERQPEFLPPLVPASDVISIVGAKQQDVTNHDVTPDGAVITPYADPPMITRSRTRHIDETTDPEDGGQADDEQLAIEDGMLMTATEEVPRCVVCLYVDDMLIASRDQDVIISVKAQIAGEFKIKERGQARYIFGIEIDYNMEDRTLGICQRAYTEAVIKKFGQEHANPSLIPFGTSVHLTKSDEPKSDEEKAKMKLKPYRSLIGSLMYQICVTRPDISVAVAKLSRFLESPGEKH